MVHTKNKSKRKGSAQRDMHPSNTLNTLTTQKQSCAKMTKS